jgi:hypothetical protein
VQVVSLNFAIGFAHDGITRNQNNRDGLRKIVLVSAKGFP